MQREIETLATKRHDEQCAKGKSCPSRAWHVRNDYIRKAARDVVAMYEAEITNMRQRYELR